MSIKSKVDIEQANKLQRKLDGLNLKRRENIEKVLDKIGATFEKFTQRRFDTKKSPSGERWKPWSPAYAEERKRSGRGTLLVLSGLMRTSLAYKVTGDSVRVGFNTDYAKYHEKGTKKMPARRMLLTARNKLGKKDLNRIERILKSFFKNPKNNIDDITE